MKEKVLEMLTFRREIFSPERPSVPGWGCSRAAVWKVMQKLKEEGYAIESVPNRGYRLSEATARLCLSEIRANLPKYHPWRDLIQFQEDIDSTNTRLKLSALPRCAPAECIADHDRRPGRRGRSFASPPTWASIFPPCCGPQCRPEELMHLILRRGRGHGPGLKMPPGSGPHQMDQRPGFRQAEADRHSHRTGAWKRKAAAWTMRSSASGSTAVRNCRISRRNCGNGRFPAHGHGRRIDTTSWPPPWSGDSVKWTRISCPTKPPFWTPTGGTASP